MAARLIACAALLALCFDALAQSQQKTPRVGADVGGLISYGHDIADMYRSAARYVDKILKGAKAAELPVEQRAKLDLVINLKTARILGVNIPHAFLVRADHVIQ